MNNEITMKTLDLVELEQIDGGNLWTCAANSITVGTLIGGAFGGPEGAFGGAVGGALYAYYYCS